MEDVMTTKAQARARDKYNGKTKRFSLRFREDELALYERLSREEAPGALIKELLERHYFGPDVKVRSIRSSTT